MERFLKRYHIDELKLFIWKIHENDPSAYGFRKPDERVSTDEYYAIRNDLIYEAIYHARKGGLKAGFSIHTPVQEIIDKDWDYRWGVVAYIELPTGQVSWHIESPDIQYDGHGYEEKAKRMKDFYKIV